jgi:DNA anti-recombination protein RmuC
MEPVSVSPALRERLGDEGTLALLELLESHGQVWRDEVLTTSSDRFGRRLSEESGALRVEMATGFAGLRQEMQQGQSVMRQAMTEGLAAVRQEMTEGLAAVRQEMGQGLAGVRQEMAQGLAAVRVETAKEFAALRREMDQGFSAVRQEIGAVRVDVIKWAFLFWVGQVATIGALMAFMLRSLVVR